MHANKINIQKEKEGNTIDIYIYKVKQQQKNTRCISVYTIIYLRDLEPLYVYESHFLSPLITLTIIIIYFLLILALTQNRNATGESIQPSFKSFLI